VSERTLTSGGTDSFFSGHKLRLPFRRKKDHPPPPPPAAQSLAPPAEEDWAGSGDLDDDAPHVRQLRSMGFSRDAAVAALEHHQYDFAAALNELLPSQGGS
jgi:epidermal growth factor receptor substrate 15